MSDLISRQTAIDTFEKELTVGESKSKYVTICSAVSYEGAKHILERLPTIDAVPVVRCKDCKNMYEDVGGAVCVYGAFVDCITPNDFYCAFGERREE